MDGRKIYEFTVTWGEQRSTDDLEGEVIESSDKRPTEDEILALLPNYTGVISQVPPQFSAIKIAGERAYDLAREGETVEIPSREVEIYRLTLLECENENTAHFEVECGKGTYVRALARDFGRDLGCFGHISGLRRSFVAPFAEDTMIPLAELVALEDIQDDEERLAALDALLIDTSEALSSLPHLIVNDDQAHRLKMGNPILVRGRDAPVEESEAYATARGKLIAIGEIGQGEFRPKRVFG
jgi:tRNA pseudouridine55 synthase